MPLLENVPDFEGIEMHVGNTAKDTEGCILVGNFYAPTVPDTISSSREAFDQLFYTLHYAWEQGEPISISVLDPEPAALET